MLDGTGVAPQYTSIMRYYCYHYYFSSRYRFLHVPQEKHFGGYCWKLSWVQPCPAFVVQCIEYIMQLGEHTVHSSEYYKYSQCPIYVLKEFFQLLVVLLLLLAAGVGFLLLVLMIKMFCC